MKKIIGLLQDLLLFIGLAFISYGVYKIYLPAGIITVGISLFVILYFWIGGRDGKK